MNQTCLSSHVLDLDLKTHKHFSIILRYFFLLLHHHGGFGVVVAVFCLQEKQVLQCKSANCTVSKFSQYPTHMTPIPGAFVCSKACDIFAERLALLVSIPAPCFFDQQAVHDKNSKGGDIRDFRTEIGRSQKSHFPSLNIARRPHITQSDLVFLNLSRASRIFGRIAGGKYFNPNFSSKKSPFA